MTPHPVMALPASWRRVMAVRGPVGLWSWLNDHYPEAFAWPVPVELHALHELNYGGWARAVLDRAGGLR